MLFPRRITSSFLISLLCVQGSVSAFSADTNAFRVQTARNKRNATAAAKPDQQLSFLQELFASLQMSEKSEAVHNWFRDPWCQNSITMEDVCKSFTGIHCDEDGWILAMDLSRKGLNGSLPSDWSSLLHLERLNLRHNDIRGEVPKILSPNLLHFNVDVNQLQGSIPTTLALSAPKLQRLILSDNRLEGTVPSDLCHFSQLKALNLSRNKGIEGYLPECLASLETLQGFQIQGTGLTGPISNEEALCQENIVNDEITNASESVSDGLCRRFAFCLDGHYQIVSREDNGTSTVSCPSCTTPSNVLASPTCQWIGPVWPPESTSSKPSNSPTQLPTNDSSPPTQEISYAPVPPAHEASFAPSLPSREPSYAPSTPSREPSNAPSTPSSEPSYAPSSHEPSYATPQPSKVPTDAPTPAPIRKEVHDNIKRYRDEKPWRSHFRNVVIKDETPSGSPSEVEIDTTSPGPTPVPNPSPGESNGPSDPLRIPKTDFYESPIFLPLFLALCGIGVGGLGLFFMTCFQRPHSHQAKIFCYGQVIPDTSNENSRYDDDEEEIIFSKVETTSKKLWDAPCASNTTFDDLMVETGFDTLNFFGEDDDKKEWGDFGTRSTETASSGDPFAATQCAVTTRNENYAHMPKRQASESATSLSRVVQPETLAADPIVRFLLDAGSKSGGTIDEIFDSENVTHLDLIGDDHPQPSRLNRKAVTSVISNGRSFLCGSTCLPMQQSDPHAPKPDTQHQQVQEHEEMWTLQMSDPERKWATKKSLDEVVANSSSLSSSTPTLNPIDSFVKEHAISQRLPLFPFPQSRNQQDELALHEYKRKFFPEEVASSEQPPPVEQIELNANAQDVSFSWSTSYDGPEIRKARKNARIQEGLSPPRGNPGCSSFRPPRFYYDKVSPGRQSAAICRSHFTSMLNFHRCQNYEDEAQSDQIESDFSPLGIQSPQDNADSLEDLVDGSGLQHKHDQEVGRGFMQSARHYVGL